jgi:ribosomal-protein-alanine N-acetyltransferase
MNLTTRQAELKDSKAVVTLLSLAYQKEYADAKLCGYLAKPYTILLLEKDANLIGVIILQFLQPEAEILDVAILPEVRQQGLGAALLAAALALVKTRGCEQVHLEVRQSNVTAIRLYEKLGFLPVGRRKNYYPKTQDTREDSILMSLKL